jgi:hypothetical protein
VADIKPQLPREICSECQKIISSRARANVFDDRIVCTPCWNRLDAPRRRSQNELEMREKLLIVPATDRQISRALADGIRFPKNATMIQLSILISLKENAYRFPNIWWEHESITCLLPIIYGVIRHHRRARWAFWSECPVPFHAVLKIAQTLEEDSSLLEIAEDIDLGEASDTVRNRASDLDDEGSGEPDEWWFVKGGGSKKKTVLYDRTIELVDQIVEPAWRTALSLRPKRWTPIAVCRILEIVPPYTSEDFGVSE